MLGINISIKNTHQTTMKNLFTKPAFAITLAVVIVVAAGIYVGLHAIHKQQYTFSTVQQGNITQTVSVSGSVQAAQNVPLAFQKAGQIQEIDVQTGQQVTAGQLIAKIDTSDASAALNQAEAAAATAQANYQKVLDGASTPQVDVAKAAVESAQVALNNAQQNVTVVQNQQATAVANANSSMLNAGLAAIPSASNGSVVTVAVTGTYTGTQQGTYTVQTSSTGSGLSYTYTGLESGSGPITAGAPLPLGKLGLFLTFPTGVTLYSNYSWTINIPNTASSAYLAAANAYQTALQTQTQQNTSAQEAVASAQAAYDQANAQLEAVVTPARPEDVAAAKASVDAAEAGVEAAQNVYADSVITAPFAGQIGSVTLKVGASVTSGQPIGTMISNGQYEVDVQLSDADIAKVKTGDGAVVSFDAYPGQQFPATLASVDTAETVDQGVPYYKGVLEFNQSDSRIQSGLTGNVVISDATHTNTLTVPSAAIIINGNSDYVLVKQSNGLTSQEKVTLGIQNSDTVEILSGLTAGQQVANF